MKNILLVDDHPAIWKYAALLIQEEYPGVVCHSSAGEEEALKIVRQIDIECVILDLQLAQGDGFSLIQKIRNRYPHIPILVVSMNEKAAAVKRVLNLGANGYISKRDDPGVIVKAVAAVVLEKQPTFLSESIQYLLVKDSVTPEPEFPDVVHLLSKREFEIFEFMGKGMTRLEIAGELNVSPSTVETHVDRIRKKLKLDSGKRLEFLAYQYISQRNEGLE